MRTFFLLSLIIVAGNTNAQLNRYIISFKYKNQQQFSLQNPAAYLSAAALQNRSKYNIAIDSLDLPVNAAYIDSIKKIPDVTILNVSKWFNQVSIYTTSAAAIAKINSYPFVSSVNTIAARTSIRNKDEKLKDSFTAVSQFQNTTTRTNAINNVFNYGTTTAEMNLHHAAFLHNIGLTGKNTVVAVMDAGFFKFNQLRSFDSALANNQLVQTWDFVDRHTSVAEDDSHGMSCLSTIIGNIPDTFVGTAPKAKFALYRTEDVNSEYPIEEFNWVCALEKADSLGATISSTSLGYTYFDDSSLSYTYDNMDGKTTIAAKGATIAHRKGMLVVTAMGNDGNNSWKYLSTPADADSIIAVGAVNSSGAVGSFSSYGPSRDGRIKPDAAAVGVGAYVQYANNMIAAGNGTSYATPKLAGLATCLWQGFPEFNNYTIRDAIIKSSSNYNTPNNRIGYGIPNMKAAFSILLNKYAKITSANFNNCIATVYWQSKEHASMQYVIERKLPGSNNFTVIKTLNATGTELINNTRFFTDTVANIQTGNIQYRIKQIIDTNSTTYTALLLDSVTLNQPFICNSIANNNTTIQITLHPNPTQHNTIISIYNNTGSSKKITVRILSDNGLLVYTSNFVATSGNNHFNLPTHNLACGMYVVELRENKNILAISKLLKL